MVSSISLIFLCSLSLLPMSIHWAFCSSQKWVPYDNNLSFFSPRERFWYRMQVNLTLWTPPISMEHSPQHWFCLQSPVSLTQGHLRRWDNPRRVHREMQCNPCVQHRPPGTADSKGWNQHSQELHGNRVRRSSLLGTTVHLLWCSEGPGKNPAGTGLKQKCYCHFSGSHK